MRLISKHYLFKKITVCRLFVFTLFLLSVDQVSAQSPLEYDARLCTAGIVVLAADIRNLLSSGSDHEYNWLEKRIQGQTSTLSWLCRRHSELNNNGRFESEPWFVMLRENINEKEWQLSLEHLAVLKSEFPFTFPISDLIKISATTIQKGGSIYTSYCHSCHLESKALQTPPVYSLTGMARSLPEEEFLARMIVGVHGAPEISLRNPLSDADIAGIYAYLLSSQAP